MIEEQFAPDQMRAMAERIERAAQPNADASEYKDTAAMLRQGADAIEVAAMTAKELRQCQTQFSRLELAIEEKRHRLD